jgi:hypothetical protein
MRQVNGTFCYKSTEEVLMGDRDRFMAITRVRRDISITLKNWKGRMKRANEGMEEREELKRQKICKLLEIITAVEKGVATDEDMQQLKQTKEEVHALYGADKFWDHLLPNFIEHGLDHHRPCDKHQGKNFTACLLHKNCSRDCDTSRRCAGCMDLLAENSTDTILLRQPGNSILCGPFYEKRCASSRGIRIRPSAVAFNVCDTKCQPRVEVLVREWNEKVKLARNMLPCLVLDDCALVVMQYFADAAYKCIACTFGL